MIHIPNRNTYMHNTIFSIVLLCGDETIVINPGCKMAIVTFILRENQDELLILYSVDSSWSGCAYMTELCKLAEELFEIDSVKGICQYFCVPVIMTPKVSTTSCIQSYLQLNTSFDRKASY